MERRYVEASLGLEDASPEEKAKKKKIREAVKRDLYRLLTNPDQLGNHEEGQRVARCIVRCWFPPVGEGGRPRTTN